MVRLEVGEQVVAREAAPGRSNLNGTIVTNLTDLGLSCQLETKGTVHEKLPALLQGHCPPICEQLSQMMPADRAPA